RGVYHARARRCRSDDHHNAADEHDRVGRARGTLRGIRPPAPRPPSPQPARRRSTMNNPLLQDSGLPAFAEIRPEFVTPAIDELLADANAALERVVGPDVPPDFDAMSAVFAVATERLSRAWRAVEHLTQVADTPALRAAHAENLPRITEFF